MTAVATKGMTADEFYEFVHWPMNRDRRFELQRGEVVEMTRPNRLHGFVCGNVAFLLGLYARQRGGGFVCSNDTGIIVETNPDTVRGPDIMFFDDVRSTDQIERSWGRTPPLLAVEVLSPNDRANVLQRRIEEQLAFGTSLIWIIDPEAERVVVIRPDQPDRSLAKDEELLGENVLPGFRCRVAELFAMPGSNA